MKKIFSIFSLLLFIITSNVISQEYTDWKWKHPQPQGNTLRWVKVWDANNWYAVGLAGTFIKTTNAGVNWFFHHKAGYPQTDFSSGTLYSGYFLNQSTGFVSGEDGVLRTTNGGVTFDTIATISSSGTIYAMYFLNNNTGFIVGTSSIKLQKTTNGGLNWSPVTPAPPATTIYDVYASSENNIIVSSSSGNVNITTNGGTTWTVVLTGASATLYAMGFIDANSGYVAGSSGTFRFTTNGGFNWTTANTPVTSTMYNLYLKNTGGTPVTKFYNGFDSTTFPPTGWRAVNVSGTNVWNRSTTQSYSAPASAYIAYQSGAGEDWLITPQISTASSDSLIFFVRKNFSSAYPPDSLIIRTSSDTALASFTNIIGKINVATLTASTWVRFAYSLSTAGSNTYIAFQHKDNNGNGMWLDNVTVNGISASTEVYTIGDANNLYKTSNNGANWTPIQVWGGTQPWTSTYFDMDMSGNTAVVVGSSGLIQKSTNGGNNFVTLSHWVYPNTLYGIFVESMNGKVWAVGGADQQGEHVLYSSNGGQSWSMQNTGSTTSKTFRSIQMVNSLTGYICGSTGTVKKTTNGGTTWDSLAVGTVTPTFYDLDFADVNTGYVFGSTGHVWKTTDAGSTWTQSVTGTTSTLETGDFVNASTGWLAGATGMLKKTTDAGATWTTQTTGATSTIYEISMIDANTGYLAGSLGLARKTTDGGTTWSTVTTPTTGTLYGLDAVNTNTVLIGGASGLILRTTNGGTTWTIDNTGGSTVNSIYMKHADSAYVAEALSYVHKYAKGPIGIAEWQNESPESFSLSQNYPNPFNPATTIKFSIPEVSKITLKIYDITGREVVSLFNDMEINKGIITYTFDGSKLSSGIYFYTLLVNGEKFDTKKMILVK